MKTKHILTTALIISSLLLTGCGYGGSSDFAESILEGRLSSQTTTTETPTSEDIMVETTATTADEQTTTDEPVSEESTTDEMTTAEELTTIEEPTTTKEPSTTEEPVSGDSESVTEADKAFAAYLGEIAGKSTASTDSTMVVTWYRYKYTSKSNGDGYYVLDCVDFKNYAIADFDGDGERELALCYQVSYEDGSVDDSYGYHLYEYEPETGDVVCDEDGFARVAGDTEGTSGEVILQDLSSFDETGVQIYDFTQTNIDKLATQAGVTVTESSYTEDDAYQGVYNYLATSNYDFDAMKEYNGSLTTEDWSDSQYRVTLRSYTGSYTYYYVDKSTGLTYAADYVPGVMESEVAIGVTFYIQDYLN